MHAAIIMTRGRFVYIITKLVLGARTWYADHLYPLSYRVSRSATHNAIVLASYIESANISNYCIYLCNFLYFLYFSHLYIHFYNLIYVRYLYIVFYIFLLFIVFRYLLISKIISISSGINSFMGWLKPTFKIKKLLLS